MRAIIRAVFYKLRKAVLADRAQIELLISESARSLSRGHYSEKQIDAALASVFGVDTALIEDETYFVAEAAGRIIGCGGWSKRKTLFGGDQIAKRDAGLLNPESDAAKIRAFFVHPNHARKGVARSILERCESEAVRSGFRSAELMSTLPGVPFYLACGYQTQPAVVYETPGGVVLDFVPMKKMLRKNPPSASELELRGGS